MINTGVTTVFYAPGFGERFVPIQNDQGLKLKRLVMPVPVFMTGNCGVLMRASVKAAAERWSQASKGKVSFNFVPKRIPPTSNGIVFDYTETGWIGDTHALATTWFPMGFNIPAILFTQTVLNGRAIKWHRGKPFFVASDGHHKALADYDNTILHEMGHALGLNHSEKSEAVMWPYIHDGGDKLAQDDIDGINALYA